MVQRTDGDKLNSSDFPMRSSAIEMGGSYLVDDFVSNQLKESSIEEPLLPHKPSASLAGKSQDLQEPVALR